MHDVATNPVSIAEGTLRSTGQHLQSGDFTAFLACFRLPYVVTTFAGSRTLQYDEDMIRVFNEIRGSFISEGVARMERYVDEASFIADDEIISTHVSRMFLADGTEVANYPCMSNLRQVGGVWLIASSQYAIEPGSPYGRAIHDKPVLKGDAALTATFDAVLARTTRAYLDGDYTAFRGCVMLPLYFQSRSGHQMLTTEDELRKDFALYMEEFALHSVKDILRVTKHVHRLGESKMVGTYTTHVLSDTGLLVPSYDSSMTIEQDTAGDWRVSSVVHALGHLQWADRAPGRPNAPLFEVLTTKRPAEG